VEIVLWIYKVVNHRNAIRLSKKIKFMSSCEVIVQEAPVATQRSGQEKVEDADPHPSNILQPARVRRSVCFGDGMDKLLLDNRFGFLFHLNFLFLAILHFIEKRVG
jgi:hypothetical protein